MPEVAGWARARGRASRARVGEDISLIGFRFMNWEFSVLRLALYFLMWKFSAGIGEISCDLWKFRVARGKSAVHAVKCGELRTLDGI